MLSPKKIMILDAYNNFARNFVMDPSLGSDGSPIGACKGFLKTLQKLMREEEPDKVIIVWDAPGGSKKRKKLISNYKDGRQPFRLNRNIRNLSEDEEKENKIHQFIKLIDYLNEMPVIQIMINDIEADDVIGWICNSSIFKNDSKLIVSNDKDFIQLCSDNVTLLRPTQKQYLNSSSVLEEYSIHPNNFALAKAIVGDKSDNIVGVKGAGFPTVAKRLPFLADSKFYTLSELINLVKSLDDGKTKFFSSILEDSKKIETNYKAVQLYSPNISIAKIKRIEESILNFIPQFNKTEVIKKMMKDGIVDYNWENMFSKFRHFVFSFEQTKN